jgi:mevalonate kinase
LIDEERKKKMLEIAQIIAKSEQQINEIRKVLTIERNNYETRIKELINRERELREQHENEIKNFLREISILKGTILKLEQTKENLQQKINILQEQLMQKEKSSEK